MSKELIKKYGELEWNESIQFETGFSDVEICMPEWIEKQCAIIALEHTIEALEKLSWNDIRPSIETKLMDSLIGEEVLEYQEQLEELKTK